MKERELQQGQVYYHYDIYGLDEITFIEKKGTKYTNVIKGQNVVIFNDYFEAESMKAYNIKYSYYIKSVHFKSIWF